VRAHPAGVRTAVAVVDLLVVPRGRQRHADLAVEQGEERRLLAAQELFDDDPVAGGAEDPLLEEEAERALRVLVRLDDQDALAAGEPVRLEDDREAVMLDRLARLLRGGADRRIGRRDVVPLEELLGEHLRRLDLRGQTRRPEDRELPLDELVDDAEGKR